MICGVKGFIYYVFPFLLCGAGMGEEKSFGSFSDALSGLSAETYAAREAASVYLWENSDVPELEKHLEHEDPEIRHRVKEVLLFITSGIKPDTPEEIRALVEEFHSADAQRKVSITEELGELEAYYPLFALYKHTEDEKIKEILGAKVSPLLKVAVNKYLNEGEVETALSIIDLSEESVGNARLWSGVISYYGDPQKELKELRAEKKRLPFQEMKYLALLRAQGKMKEAEEMALASGDQAYLASRWLLKKDYAGYLNWWKEEFAEIGVSEDLLNAYELRLSGKWDELDDYYSVIIDQSTSGKRGKQRAILNLLALGKNEAAYALASKEEKIMMASFLTDKDRYEELFGYFDFPFGGTPSEKWIKKHIDNEQGEWWFSSSSEQLDKLGIALLGLNDEASIDLMLAPLWRDIKDDKDAAHEFITMLSSEANGSFIHYALKYAEELMEENDLRLRQIFLGNNDLYKYLWELSETVHPDLSFSQRVKLLLACTVSAQVDGEEQMEDISLLLSAMEEDCAAHPEDETRETHLASLYIYLGFQEENLKYREAQYEKKPNQENLGHLIGQLLFLDKWEEASRLAEDLDYSEQGNATLLSLYKASIFLKAGKEEPAQTILDEHLKEVLNDPNGLHIASGMYTKQGVDSVAVQLMEKGLSLTNPDEQGGYYWAKLLERGISLYKSEGNYHMAALCGEAYIIHSLKQLYQVRDLLLGSVGIRNLDDIANKRYDTDLMWAKYYALEAGEPERARALCKELAKEWNAHGKLADDFYPFLREAGFTDILESSLEKSVAQIKANLAHYPQTHNLKNTIGWLSSRAVMNLEEAETLMAEARSASPRSGPYLDTSAEVFFALGNREKALQLSKRAWQDAITFHMYPESIQMIKNQYYYFRDTPLPTEPTE